MPVRRLRQTQSVDGEAFRMGEVVPAWSPPPIRGTKSMSALDYLTDSRAARHAAQAIIEGHDLALSLEQLDV